MPNVTVEVKTKIPRKKYQFLIDSKGLAIAANPEAEEGETGGIGRRDCTVGKHVLFWRMRGKAGDKLGIKLTGVKAIEPFESEIPEGETLGFGGLRFEVEAG